MFKIAKKNKNIKSNTKNQANKLKHIHAHIIEVSTVSIHVFTCT